MPKNTRKKPVRRRGSRIATAILILVMVVGAGVMAYPSVSDFLNSRRQVKAIETYVEAVEQLDETQYDALWQEAVAYNEEFARHPLSWDPTEEEKARYNRVLDVSGTGIMGYINIPKINCRLPIYHGTEEDVLQRAIGHLVGTSLPVGGATSHSVLSGHTGLPSAKLFSRLDELVIGDIFTLQILNETLTYQVDQIQIVLPSEISSLALSPGQDLCTLVTCYPVSVNSHRLLVRGHRVDNLPEETDIPEVTVPTQDEASVVSRWITIPAVGIPCLFVFLILMILITGKPKKPIQQNEHSEEGGAENTHENENANSP